MAATPTGLVTFPTNPQNVTDLLTNDVMSLCEYLVQGSNGGSTYSNEKALYGFVPTHQFLQVPGSFHAISSVGIRVDATVKSFPDIDLDVFGSEKGVSAMLGGTAAGAEYIAKTMYLYYDSNVVANKIAFMNYAAMTAGGMDNKSAYICAALRSRWCTLGAYNISCDDTSRPFSEVTVTATVPRPPTVAGVDPLDTRTTLQKIASATTITGIFAADLTLAAGFLNESNNATSGVSWIIFNAEIIWGITEFLVRVRGHHYKEAYETMISKVFTACHEGEYELPDGIDLANVFRTSIHPFGLRALPILAAHFSIHGKQPNALLIRHTGAPNGMAVVTTTAACLRAMAGEPWYGQFRTLYNPQITLLEAIEKEVLGNKFGYHQSSRLFGVTTKTSCTIDNKTYTVVRMREGGAGMAPIAQGFIQAMREAKAANQIAEFSFSNAKVTEKHAGGNPLITLRIKSLIIFAISAIADAKSMESATNAALPALKEKKDKEVVDTN